MVRKGKVAGIALLAVAVVLAVSVTFTIGWRPLIGPRTRSLTDRKFEVTPERLTRGKYLAVGLMGCVDCHSEHDWKAPGGPPIESRPGAGVIFPLAGLPGRVVAPNITPDPETGAGNWTDDQLARAIREGVGHDGRALFPLMPYPSFRQMSNEDLAAVIVYLRYLPPVRNLLPKTELAFPVEYLIRSVPQPVTTPVPSPDVSDPVKRGAYLATMADCITCHTPQFKGQLNLAMPFAGGFVLKGPWGEVASTNITPDTFGIGYYNEALFLQVMRTGYVGGARNLNPIMPWNNFRHLSDDDLKAILA